MNNNYNKEILSPLFTRAVDELNKISGLENKFVYRYDNHNNWYDIIHAVEDDLQKNDEIAKKISDILYNHIISNEVYNFSFYEDKSIIGETTYEFSSRINKVIKDKSIKSFNRFDLPSFETKPSKSIGSYDLKIA
ncbi:hypothetical protein BU645_11785 [Staphylococcus chromogenes]|uniref:hypothetical protein n=1 Tax=Staphylococcus chromogenes TaxID=46126 RepID=UPI000D1B617F|nr:hypothetical protein [Staphylococcus chromogenes]PTG88112.1 hypothetical protein BU645_11785 [Staphylococcus chromogenes]